ncbi:semaphorin-5a isoform 1, partial [Lynx pardinus]
MPMCPTPPCRDGQRRDPWLQVALNGFLLLLVSPHRYCNEHFLWPPHMFWTSWGPWEPCTAQCGGGTQARRRTCENGPGCVGCNV